jgi:hypothetical protein
VKHAMQRDEAMMEGGQRAVDHLLHVMPTWDRHTHWAFIAFLLTVFEGWNRPPDSAFAEHAHRCMVEILETIPGVIQKVPVQ